MSVSENAMDEFDRQRSNRTLLESAGAYSESMEHDACGVGLVAAIDGQAKRSVVEAGLAALKAIWHRGAVDADGKTGDGAGIHLEIPLQFFKDHITRTGHEPRGGHISIGMIFLPRTDYAAQEVCRTIVETEILRFGYYIYGWRQVPVNTSVIGQKANATRPEIEQIMFAETRGLEREEVERELYIIRRRIEKRVLEANISDFYVCSLSSRSIIYKGMFLAEQIDAFYPDLKDERFESSFAIYHQRYSTNTFPTWRLAQPFRMLAHNGEINTIKGNMNWMRSHEIRMVSQSYGEYGEQIKPIIQPGSSDSAALDSVFEVLVRAGRTAPQAKTLLIPEVWATKATHMSDAWRAMYAYCNSVMEPWDGPAAIAATDGRWIIAGMDRNGLRPMRFTRTIDGLLVVGSETGMVPIDEQLIEEKGRLGPGQMIAVDLVAGEFFRDEAIKDKLAAGLPFEEWSKNIKQLDGTVRPGPEERLFDEQELKRRKLAAGYTFEDIELILTPLVEDAKEPTGSMGDDTPLGVFSEKYRPMSHFFKQNFSQVTNPPIDPLRERRVMSLKTRFGNLGNVLAEDSSQTEIYMLQSPILSNGMWGRLKTALGDDYRDIDCCFDVVAIEDADGSVLKAAIERIQQEAEEAVRSGCGHLMLTDEGLSGDRAGIPMILAVSAIHNYLVAKGLRTFTSINVRSAECLDTHYFAVLIGMGATTINAYLAQEIVADRFDKGLHKPSTLGQCMINYMDAIDQGLLKIMSKMGISMISSYRTGANFEALGLSRALVDAYFPAVPSRISGIGLSGLERKTLRQHAKAYGEENTQIPIGGFYRFRRGEETHAFQGEMIHLLQKAVAEDSYGTYKKYSKALATQAPINPRDLLDFRSPQRSIPVDEVESINEIRKRFVTPGMSLGALSPEAHGTLNIAMNRIGAKSVSGEGGEDPERFKPMANGDNANSAIKQVASGRFGVTAEYLNHCREIEIKVAQGAKPGEGGQLPGFKVTSLIARLRHSTEGVTLISPPPHHDIYSIEDLAQLIYDLKQINPDARVCVKLVAATGVGTIAAGVAKAHADVILISGNSGGTGASPQTSIKHAGIPWEMGLSEANQILTLNNLRHRVVLRADGGIRTGRDVVIAAMMGAEEFGVGTVSLIAMGCIMVRQCHSNTCPVGVCTQDEDLRSRFSGTAEKVVNLFGFIAEEVREILSELGFSSLKEIIGRTDLLAQISRGAEHLDDLDLNPLLVQLDSGNNARFCTLEGRNPVPDTLDEQIVRDAAPMLTDGEKMQLTYTVRNTQRAIGTRTSSHIVRKYGPDGLNDGHLTVRLRGSAGQSLGAFGVKGLKLELFGDANDYVGKGLSGATIVVRMMTMTSLVTQENTIIGNTCLYGATSGYLYASGQAGERFAVRNSGATAVIEGCGSNGCEYMTGGVVVILGAIGDNFAAGMTGGMAFVYDPEGVFDEHVNAETVVWQRLQSAHWERIVHAQIEAHVKETNSHHAKSILSHWDVERHNFLQVCPMEMLERLEHPLSDAA